jgi:hypothetical protein
MIRRRRTARSVLGLFCASCTILFVFGNLLLHDGFLSVSSADVFLESSSSRTEEQPQHGPSLLQRALLPPSDSMALKLPAAALGAETKLRHLMNSANYQPNSGNSSDAATVRLTPEDMRNILADTSDCDVINRANFTRKSFIASGWTKAVYRGRFYGNDVAIKTVDSGGHDVSMCQQHHGLSEEQCYDRAAHKLLKETLLLQSLRHPHIVEVSHPLVVF